MHAFIEMTSIPAENDPGIYLEITPAWECIQETNMATGVTTYRLRCLGDLFLQGCQGFAKPECPAVTQAVQDPVPATQSAQ